MKNGINYYINYYLRKWNNIVKILKGIENILDDAINNFSLSNINKLFEQTKIIQIKELKKKILLNQMISYGRRKELLLSLRVLLKWNKNIKLEMYLNLLRQIKQKHRK